MFVHIKPSPPESIFFTVLAIIHAFFGISLLIQDDERYFSRFAMAFGLAAVSKIVEQLQELIDLKKNNR